MTLRAKAIVAVVVLLGGLLAVFSVLNARGASPSEIAQRVAASHPTWDNYPEDIKAQIGAALVAEWEGKPVSVDREGDRIRITFALHGPWVQRREAIPILLRDPLGATHENSSALFPADQPGRVVYVFGLDAEAVETPLPWVEIKFPHGERRIVLSNGRWQAEGQ